MLVTVLHMLFVVGTVGLEIRPPEGSASVAPVSSVPTKICTGLSRTSNTVRVIVPPGARSMFCRCMMS